jgi:hypothetical protein
MYRFALFAVFASIASAQTDPFAPKPPAGVEAALLARVKEFYDYHVKGKPRLAEALVAEDSKDIFYAHPKPEFLECRTASNIEYTDRFTKAKVTEICKQTVAFPGAGPIETDVPMPSYWKIENGKWFYYVDPAMMNRTPFGVMQPGPASKVPGMGAPALPSDINAMAESLLKKTRLDKDAVRLKPGELAEVTITNGAPGPITLTLPKFSNGIEAKLDKSQVEAGGTAVLKLSAGKEAASGTITLEVAPSGQQLPIQITIAKE